MIFIDFPALVAIVAKLLLSPWIFTSMPLILENLFTFRKRVDLVYAMGYFVVLEKVIRKLSKSVICLASK